MRVVCEKNELRIIDYSAYNELGEARRKEPGAIDVDSLSTWKATDNGLNVPDKTLPYVKMCRLNSGKYKVILTNAGGGHSSPYPVVNVSEISDPRHAKSLISNLELNHEMRNRYEIIFNLEYPKGKIIDE